MNFITELLLSKRKDIVYDFIFVIVDCCTKMARYISIIIKLDAAKLTKIFFIEIVFIYDMFEKIVSDRRSLFISVF